MKISTKKYLNLPTRNLKKTFAKNEGNGRFSTSTISFLPELHKDLWHQRRSRPEFDTLLIFQLSVLGSNFSDFLGCNMALE